MVQQCKERSWHGSEGGSARAGVGTPPPVSPNRSRQGRVDVAYKNFVKFYVRTICIGPETPAPHGHFRQHPLQTQKPIRALTRTGSLTRNAMRCVNG